MPIAGSRRAVELMPRARLVEVGGVGHWVQLEDHGTVLREVRTFVGELGPA